MKAVLVFVDGTIGDARAPGAAPGGVKVRFAQAADLAWCAATDRLVPEVVINRKIDLREIIVAEAQGQMVGYLRLEYLWSKIPYIGLIFVRQGLRRRGVGRAILAFLEAFLREAGHKVLLSSSQVNEPLSQAWHRAVGFSECGVLAGINEGTVGELFFRKNLT